MKKIKYAILISALATQMILPSFAGVQEQDVLNNLGIMTYNNGDFQEYNYLTRGMMAKILVTSSKYKDNIIYSNISPFADVTTAHWSSPYVTTAVNNGLLRGYLDGTFKPDQYIKAEEVVTAVLNLLGYTDFTGTYPYGQMTYAESIGLLDDVNVSIGNNITRGDTATIIYNAINTKNNNGVYHSTVFGYNTEELTMEDLIEEDEFDDPILTTYSNNYEGYKIYVDGKSANVVPINSVAYINNSSKMVYAYTTKISGAIQSISPNVEEPTAITISGKTYSLSTEMAQEAVSFDGYSVNDYVTCVLDKNGDVGAVIDFSNQNVVGIIADSGINSNGYSVTMLTIDGDMFEYNCSVNYEDEVGSLYEISNEGEFNKKTFKSTLSGTFNSTNMTFAGENISNNVKIYDINNLGEIITVIPQRLHNVKLSTSDILYIGYDTEGQISSLILNNITNDADLYAYMTEINVTDKSNSVSSSYTYVLKGSTATKTVSSINNSIGLGAFRLQLDGASISYMKNLTEISSNLNTINQYNLTFDDGSQHTITQDVVVYTMVGTTPVLTDFNDINLFNATFYYDKLQANGGAIRMIIVK